MKLIDKIITFSEIIDKQHLDKYLKSTWYSSDKKCINKWICSFVILRSLALISMFCLLISFTLLSINREFANTPYEKCIWNCCNIVADSLGRIGVDYKSDCNTNETLNSLCETDCSSQYNPNSTSYRSFISQVFFISFNMTIILFVIVFMMHRYIPKIIIKYIKEITDQEKALLDKSLIKPIIHYEGNYGGGCGGIGGGGGDGIVGGRESLSSITFD